MCFNCLKILYLDTGSFLFAQNWQKSLQVDNTAQLKSTREDQQAVRVVMERIVMERVVTVRFVIVRFVIVMERVVTVRFVIVRFVMERVVTVRFVIELIAIKRVLKEKMRPVVTLFVQH